MLKADRKNIFIIIAVIGLLIFLHYTKVLLPLEGLVRGAVNPVLKSLFSASNRFRGGDAAFSENENLLNELKKLELDLNRLSAENTRLKLLEEENQKLREFLNFFDEHEYQYILADVISRGDLIDMPLKTRELIINKGEKDGLKPGQPALDSRGVIVGKLLEVKSNEAKVVLVSDGKCKLAATILNNDKTSGITEGSLGLTTRMKFIPQTEAVNIGDIIVTSGLEAEIPRGLIIGKATKVDRESNEVWQEAAIEPMINFNELTVVSVLLTN